MSNPTDPTCLAACEWLSAARDGEAAHDAALAGHVDSCTDCTAWADGLDVVTRTTRLRAPNAPRTLAASLPPLGAADRATDGAAAVTAARSVLAIAAVSGVLAVLLGMSNVIGHAHLGSIDGRDAWGMKIALLVGFALAAWRPHRHAAGLLPIATIAAIVTVGTSVIALSGGETRLLDEVLHLPILLGAIGSVLAFRAASAPVALAVESPTTAHA